MNKMVKIGIFWDNLGSSDTIVMLESYLLQTCTKNKLHSENSLKKSEP